MAADISFTDAGAVVTRAAGAFYDYVSDNKSLPYSIEALLIGRKRAISAKENGITIIPDVVISEEHNDEVVLTRHPVDTGAPITDHAYRNPAVLNVKFAWSDSSRLLNSTFSGSILKGVTTTKDVYKQLLSLMQKRELLSVSTGKRSYDSMIITRLVTSTDKDSESSLSCDITFEEVMIVSTKEVELQAVNQANPAKTAGTVDGGNRQAEMTTTEAADITAQNAGE